MAMQSTIAQTQLWLGNPTHVQERICAYIAEQTGYALEAIRSEQHPFVVWVKPEGVYYKRSELAPIFYRTSLCTADDEKWFIVITAADRLTHSTANSLLKVLEEPPEGYTFILSAYYRDWVLPTIRSRAVIYEEFGGEHQVYPLVAGCYEYKKTSYVQFAQLLREHTPSEYETRAALDALLHRWCSRREEFSHDPSACLLLDAAIRILIHYAELLPSSGSAKYFWRDLFVSLKLLER